MDSNEIRLKFLKFFESRGHKIIPSSSLVPENDPSVLFTTAGMQQFKPYYINPKEADKDFSNRNIVTIQKCIRTGDIDEVGDDTHLTFFEMLGNFSFGGYGRREAITYAHDFITKEMNLDISYVTIYKGSENVPKDDDSEKIWKELSVKDIREDGNDVFWGPTGDCGPCGPTTEIYCKNAAGQDVEIWNIVFNEYFCDGSREKLDKGEALLKKLDVLGIDTGMGLERLATTVQKKRSVYGTDLFNNEETREERIVADHVKAALFMISDGVVPLNTGAGYVLRRLIRRAVRFSKKPLAQEIERIKKIYKNTYVLDDKGEIEREENKFREKLEHGLKEFENRIETYINGTLTDKILRPDIVFTLYTSYGFPIELIKEEAEKRGLGIDLVAFEEDMAEHQKLSQTASAGMFKGGLADAGVESTKYHTATHLLLAALRKVLGKEIVQKGSNITAERMRFDFNWPEKVQADKLKEVEALVNQKIQEAIPVEMMELPKEEAVKIVKNLSFDLSKYGDIVKVYKIGDFSIEFCGGPHVKNTNELGQFKIQKEEASAQGIRRIKAVLL
jgi:alanyl-tRNA synthetase